jgi:hypothetical protein
VIGESVGFSWATDTAATTPIKSAAQDILRIIAPIHTKGEREFPAPLGVTHALQQH